MMTETLRLIKRTPVFKKNYEVLLNSQKRYICNEGGSRSGKTFGITMAIIKYADETPNRAITICSHSLPHLKRGAMRDFFYIIQDWGIYKEQWHNRTDNIYKFPNGTYVEFVGLEEADRARGAGRDLLFVNECNLISKQLFDQLDIRTRWKVITDLNPSDYDCWAYALADGKDADLIRSNYKNNISNLPEVQVRVIESYKDADPNGLMWKVFGLGERGASEEQIYTHYKLCDQLPGKGATWYGLDFGYNVQTALVKVEFFEGSIYVEEVIYQTRLTTSDLVLELKKVNIGEYDEVYCDAAEPKTIEELYRAGINAMPADKDVTEGIRKVKSYPVYITNKSGNLRKELGSYKWKKDKNDKVLDEPTKENDHLCDALRYAVFTRLKNNEAEFFMM